MRLSLRRWTRASAVFLLFLCLSTSAAAVTLDFDFIIGDGTQDFGVCSEDGFELTVDFGAVRVDEFTIPGTGVAFPNFGFDNQVMTLTESLGAGVNVTSIDLSEQLTTTDTLTVEFVGTRADSSTVTTNFSLDGTKGLETFVFSGFTGLVSLTFGGGTTPDNLVIDNVEVSVVPIPAAVWLFRSALSLLGWMRRGIA